MIKKKSRACLIFSAILPGVFLFTGISAQELNFRLNNGGSTMFRQYLWIYGIKNTIENDFACIYKIDTAQLSVRDSIFYKLPKKSAKGWLQLSSDTLHQRLSIHIQASGSNSVQVLRYDAGSKTATFIPNIEIARLNNSAMFSEERMFYNDHIYDVTNVKDSSGSQYYLNHYEVNNLNSNYEYSRRWQFPFEKKDIADVKLMQVDAANVLVTVRRRSEGAESLWLLQIKTNNGQLFKATRIDNKEKDAVLQVYTVDRSKTTREVYVTGQKFTNPDKGLRIWLTVLDSGLVNMSRHEFLIDLKNAQNSTMRNPRMAPERPIINQNGDISFRTELYMQEGKCYYFCNVSELKFSKNDNGFSCNQKQFTIDNGILFFYRSPDKNDMNGKSCDTEFSKPRSAVLLDATFYAGKSAFLLQKKNLKKNSVNISSLVYENQKNKMSTIFDLPLAEVISIYPLFGRKFLCCRQKEGSVISASIYNW